MHRVFYKDDRGFTTVGAAVALLLVFSLTFLGVKAFWIQNRSANIQYVADAGALAADNAVAEFVTLGQVVDAALLSMSLLGLTTYAAATVAAFIPGGQSVSTKLMGVGNKLFKARDSAAKSAVKGLNAAQKALPVICAIRASACVRANGKQYTGLAVPLPLEGITYKLPDTSKVDEAAQSLQEQNDEVAEGVEQAQRLQEEMESTKREAWLADCGSSGMNMRERAGHLAGLSGASNPDFSSPETWSFSVALERSRAYYQQRYESEAAESFAGSPELVAESVARKRFYRYALSMVNKSSVSESRNGAEVPHFEHLARNMEQVKAAGLCSEAIYPLSRGPNGLVLHAYAACPGCAAGVSAGFGSADMVDSGAAHKCEHCQFSSSTLGRVPAASTSIDNGFEYYYRIVADKADGYRAAVQQSEELQKELDDSKKKAVQAFRKGLKSLKGIRYDPQPPGRYGCICVVYAQEEQGKALPFSTDAPKAGKRVAISGATLAADTSSDQGNIIAEVGNNLLPEHMFGSQLVKSIFGLWGNALQAYGGAKDSVKTLLDKTIGSIPLVGTQLSSWVVSGFEKAIDDAGLEPAQLQTYKPVLVNTAHIASRDDSAAARALLKMKTAAQAYGDVSAGDLDALIQTLDISGKVEGLTDSLPPLLSIPFSALGLAANDTELKMGVPVDALGEYRLPSVSGAGG